ncbi:MAG: hypothetical protein IJ776_07170 [Paludibacteraceae bacterium]|nr:hypothetical protein [Paludibacteraceae bacterium]
MKHFIPFVCIVAVLFAACKNGEPELKLKVEPSVITCPDTGGDYEVELTSANAWTADVSESWIKLTPASGEAGTSTVRIKISANKESAESTGKITFTDGANTTELPVTRAAKAPAQLSVVSETEINAPRDGGEYTIQVESNIRWSASSNVSWAQVSKGVSQNNDNVTIIVSPATTPEETVATITVAPYGEGKEAGEQTVTITRGGSDATSMSVDPAKIDASSDGGNYTVNVSTTAKWRAWTTWDVDWFKLSNTEGEGDGTFGVTIDPATSTGDMTGIITIEEVRTDNYKPVVSQVTVTRKGKAAASLSVTPTKTDAPAAGGEFPVTIKSNYPWTASVVGAKYFSISINKGDGDATMIVTVKPTTEEQEATGSVTITSSFGGEQARINIRRAAMVPQLRIYPVLISSTADGGEYTLNLTANCAWKGTSSDTKVASFYPQSGTGSASISVIVAPTALETSSYATLTFTTDVGSVTETVEVRRGKVQQTQLAKRLFSIADGKKVYISPGNLQYDQSTGKWSFAEYQYECIGLRARVRDLFVWGAGDDPTSEMGNILKNNDNFGMNAIYYQDNVYKPNSWRLPTRRDLWYLMGLRSNGIRLRGCATVNNIHGLVLFPDECWTSNGLNLPDGLTFKSNTRKYSANIYSVDDWRKLESIGAIFLPASGYMYNSALCEFGTSGYYWSSTTEEEKVGFSEWEIYPVYFMFSEEKWGDEIKKERITDAYSVRLIQDAN